MRRCDRLTPERRREAFFDEVLRRAAVVPGVDSAALAGITAMSGTMFAGWIRVPESTADVNRFNNNFNVVTPGYFRTVGLPIVAGRDFTASDGAAAPRVAIVINVSSSITGTESRPSDAG